MLVLNQSYEPISVCNLRKAIILLFLDKAEMVAQHDRRVLHSVCSVYPRPSVIRLNQYKRIPYKSILLSRKNILRRDGHCCQYCGTTSPPLTVDHIIPRAHGGRDTWENLVTACMRCNNRKGSNRLEHANMSLRSKPRRPSHVAFITHSVSKVEEPWKPYLFLT